MGLTTFVDIVTKLGPEYYQFLTNGSTAMTVFAPNNKVRKAPGQARCRVTP